MKYFFVYHTNVKIILLNHQNNYVEYLSVNNNIVKHFNILTNSLSPNYFNDPKTKLLLDLLYLF